MFKIMYRESLELPGLYREELKPVINLYLKNEENNSVEIQEASFKISIIFKIAMIKYIR
jgi:hypothetical protein